MNKNLKMPKNCYVIGGSPCSGKSTIAEKLSKEFGFTYYKYDNYLEKFIDLGFKKNIEPMKTIKNFTLDEMWLRDVNLQVDEEFDFYKAAIDFALFDISRLKKDKPIIVEGAGMLPELMEQLEVPKNRYICMVPSRAFQMAYYNKRGWVKPYLANCSSPEQAFENWMDRDASFAQKVEITAQQLGYNTITTDGSVDIDGIYEKVKGIFEL